MICERCQKKKVSVIHRDTHEGRLSVRHLCADCTEVLESTGELQEISAVLPSYMAPLSEESGGRFPFFFVRTNTESGSKGRNQPKCSLCGMTLSDLLVGGRAGCPRCYEVFADTLSGAISAMHGPLSHVGHVPAAVRVRKERSVQLAALRECLKEAIISEQFERAASLRDEIRALESDGIA